MPAATATHPPFVRKSAQGARLTPLALAVHLACAAALSLGLAGPASAQSAAQAAPYDVPAGPLAGALNRFAQQSGVAIALDANQVRGLNSPGLRGSYGVEEGFGILLRGSGYALGRTAAGYVLVAAPAAAAPAPATTPELDSGSTLPTVTVRAAAEPLPQQEGKAADGYRATTASSVGALGSAALLDTPFSISVVPQELIENVQAQSPDDLYKINPSTRTTVPQGTGWSPMVSIRGFKTYDSAEDGLRRLYNHAAVLEDKERVEVLNGLSGFLYGAAAPGGMVNYVYKRPTLERLNNITVGNYGGGQYYVHGDFGGRLDEAGRAGYRLNVVRQDGNTAIDDQKINRSLVSGAIDWNVTDKLLLEANAVYNDYKTQSPSAYWYYGSVPHGKAPDASKNWSQPWIRDEFENTKLMGRVTYRFTDQFTFRGAYTRNHIDRPVQDHTMNSVTADGYQQIAIRSGRTKDHFDAAQALIDAKFNTGPIAHTITTGYFTYSSKDWDTPYSPNTGWQGPYSLATPTHIPEPAFPANSSSPYLSGRVVNENWVIGDHLRFNAQWSALIGITRSRIKTQDFDADGQKYQADYGKSRNSPSVSLLFKPAAWLTTYASYIEGLEMGGRAPDEASNSGSIMPPMVSKQKEIGIKAEVGKMLLTAALFDIEKAYEYTDSNNIYTQSGRQKHKGVEFTATGKLTSRLTLLGGVTALDPSIRGGDYSGKQPTDVAKVVAKLYAEYALPVPGLVLSAGIYHTGKQWADESNTDRLPSYTTADLGLRYATKVSNHPLILRLTVSNIANRSYWMNSYYVGAPRSVAFSAQYQF